MANRSALSTQNADVDSGDPAIPEIESSGPRKLVRPPVSAALSRGRNRSADPRSLAYYESATPPSLAQPSHAEAFYLQKQIQTQTVMIFVLDDGERIEGCIEWYDKDSIKVRNHSRILIYKSCIKYMYKRSDKEGQ